MKTELVRVGVVGAGVMGERHVRTYSSQPGWLMAGVFDPDVNRAGSVAQSHGTKIFSTMAALCDEVDALTIASPTSTHAAIAREALSNGKHVLIEKPLAGDIADARMLTDLADSSVGQVVMVGHVERFNPVVDELRRVIGKRPVRSATFRRMSPFDGRCLDTDVVHDLMIHDIDLSISMFGHDVQGFEACGFAIHSTAIDEASARVRIAGTTDVTMIASRVADERVRDITVVLDGDLVTADLLNHTVITTRSRDMSIVEERYVPRQHTLPSELQHFLRCIREHERPLVDARAGLRAMEWAAAILAKIAGNAPVVRSVSSLTAVAG